MKTCHCGGELTKEQELLHCAGCGCWFVKPGLLDPNHSSCRQAQREAVPVAGQVPAAPEPFEEPREEATASEDSATPERRVKRRTA